MNTERKIPVEEFPAIAKMLDELAQHVANADGLLDHAAANRLLPRCAHLLRRLLVGSSNVVSDILVETRLTYREYLLDYLRRLVALGVSPDAALDFLAKHEAPALRGAPDLIGEALAALREVLSLALGDSLDVGSLLKIVMPSGGAADSPGDDYVQAERKVQEILDAAIAGIKPDTDADTEDDEAEENQDD